MAVARVHHTSDVWEALFQSQHVSMADNTLYVYIVTDDTGMKKQPTVTMGNGLHLKFH